MYDYREIPFSPPDITDDEINEVVDTLKSGWITTGPKVKQFEKGIANYVGVNRAVCLNSATAAMELTLRILGVGPGDEVITTAYTYTATASVIHHVGAKIVLIDTSPKSYEMDYNQMEEAINEKTKVIIPVDIAGKMCNYEEIFRLVENKKNLFKPNSEIQETFNRVIVMADAAHSFGASQNGEKSGKVADFSCFSFHAVKNLTTSEGGAVVWRNDRGLDDNIIYNQYMLYSLHGQSKDALAKSKKGSWEYDIIYPAYKCNMTDIMASIGLAQLKTYSKKLEKRKQIIYSYDKGLLDENTVGISHLIPSNFSSGHLYFVEILDISLEERNKLINLLAKSGITCNVHYKPLPMLTAYKNLGFDINEYPNALRHYTRQISLPLHTKLSDIDIKFIIENFNLLKKQI